MSQGSAELLEARLTGRLAGRLAGHVQASEVPWPGQEVSWMEYAPDELEQAQRRIFHAAP